MSISRPNKNDEALWQQFAEQQKLSPHQLDQFKQYYALLVAANEEFNLTTITGLRPVINYHFIDSLMVREVYDFTNCRGVADIGTGAGFPGIPLKIIYPELPVLLIEVTKKKIAFLNSVIDKLGFDFVDIYALDWRTFLRKTDYQLDVFCARASLPLAELFRMLKPASSYNEATLVYWATTSWVPTDAEKEYLTKEYAYTVGAKRRKLAVFNRGG